MRMLLLKIFITVIMVGSQNLEDLAAGLPSLVYPVFDLYGKCDKISIINGSDAARNGTPIIEEAVALEDEQTLDDGNIPQCEKADLEKETEANPMPMSTSATAMYVMLQF